MTRNNGAEAPLYLVKVNITGYSNDCLSVGNRILLAKSPELALLRRKAIRLGRFGLLIGVAGKLCMHIVIEFAGAVGRELYLSG